MSRAINHALGALRESFAATQTQIKDQVAKLNHLEKETEIGQSKLADLHEKEKQLQEAMKEYGE